MTRENTPHHKDETLRMINIKQDTSLWRDKSLAWGSGTIELNGADIPITFIASTQDRSLCALGIGKHGIVTKALISRTQCGDTLATLTDHDQTVIAEQVSHTLNTQNTLSSPAKDSSHDTPITVRVHTTDFTLRIYRALCCVPLGERISYGELAVKAGYTPMHARAVGTAMARNLVALIIPCHRVVRQDGNIDHYSWGGHYKHAILKHEQQRYHGIQSLSLSSLEVSSL